jgi:hypothetical protein
MWLANPWALPTFWNARMAFCTLMKKEIEQMKQMMTSRRLMYVCAIICATVLGMCASCTEMDDGVEIMAMTDETCPPAELLDGTVISATTRPEVGQIAGCTATLISEQWFITAAHCVAYGNPTGGTFTTGTHSYPISRVYSLNNDAGTFDVAIGRLSTQVPASVATPAKLAEVAPISGEQVTVFGFGCNVRPNGGTSTKRYTTFNWGTSNRLCPGDSGGPVRRGGLNSGGEIVGINSAYSFVDSNGNGQYDPGESAWDIYADPTLLKPRVEAIMRSVDRQLEVGIDRGGFDITNTYISNSSGNGPVLCQEACRKNKNCKSFTYALSTQRCWLKDAIPDASPNANAISGFPMNPGTFNRGGSDYTHYSVARAEICEADCAADSNCDAYTYTSAGVCWLKNAIPAVSTCSTCKSGNRRSMEPNIDRPGGDYTSFWTTSLDPFTCADSCARAARCRAWTYVPRGVQGTYARCWLKDEVRDPVRNTRTGAGVPMTSGVKMGMEANVDRGGSDYRSYFISTPEPQICQAACYSESQCRAWTYVPPGVQGAQARCWLKNAIPAPTTGIGMVSGRKGLELF